MDVYNPVFKITWPGPGVIGISIVLSLLFIVVVVYLIITYLNIKERERMHNYQLFLFQVKRKGLTDFQIKILNNMASYLRLSSPTSLVANAALFESILSDFTEYLKRSSESSEEQRGICRDLLVIYEKLYIQPSYRAPLESMSGIENGQILHVSAEIGGAYLGKVSGRGKNFIALQLFAPLKSLKDFETGQPLAIYLIRINDAEYRINTKSSGIEDNRLLVELSDDFVREKEYRHPYVSVVVPAVIAPSVQRGEDEEARFDGTIYKLNEYECELRSGSPMAFDRSYAISFEVSGYMFNVTSKVITSRTVEHEKVYYVTLKFTNMTRPAAAVLTRFINDNM